MDLCFAILNYFGLSCVCKYKRYLMSLRFGFLRRPGTFHVLLLLLLGGDIHCYPCGVCKKSVARTHRGFQCDICVKWFHIKCVGSICYPVSSFELQGEKQNKQPTRTKHFFLRSKGYKGSTMM